MNQSPLARKCTWICESASGRARSRHRRALFIDVSCTRFQVCVRAAIARTCDCVRAPMGKVGTVECGETGSRGRGAPLAVPSPRCLPDQQLTRNTLLPLFENRNLNKPSRFIYLRTHLKCVPARGCDVYTFYAFIIFPAKHSSAPVTRAILITGIMSTVLAPSPLMETFSSTCNGVITPRSSSCSGNGSKCLQFQVVPRESSWFPPRFFWLHIPHRSKVDIWWYQLQYGICKQFFFGFLGISRFTTVRSYVRYVKRCGDSMISCTFTYFTIIE